MMIELNSNFQIISFLFFLLLLTSCTSENNNNESVIVGEITEIKFNILDKHGHYCDITRAYISTNIYSSIDTVIQLQSMDIPGCNFEKTSSLLFKLNDIELPLIAISSDSLIKIKLNEHEMFPLVFSIQQGTSINFGLNAENNVDKLNSAIKDRDDFFRLINSDSLYFSRILSLGNGKKINIRANNKTDIIYQLDGKLINKRYFSKEYFDEVPPPKNGFTK